MKTFKDGIIDEFINDNYIGNTPKSDALNKIMTAIRWAWDNWNAEIIQTYYIGEKPINPPIVFVINWIENEDFECDGYNIEKLNEIFL